MTTHMAIVPRSPVSIRPATAADLAFIDGLQKLHAKQVGWMPAKQLEEKVALGHVLVAEAMGDGRGEMGDVQTAGAVKGASDRDSGISISLLPSAISHRPSTLSHPPSPISHLPSTLSHPTPVGYLIARDQYMKRDDVGIVYQLNVVPGRQRGLIGAALLKAQFERSAYGCRLYCCWCAQDIAANHFWEAMGFVPLAFRTGSERKARVHIFWQRRVRQGDTATPWWFPSQTSGGSIREDRIVLPIPPGTHWSDAKPIVLPGREGHHGDTEDTEKTERRVPSAECRTGKAGAMAHKAASPRRGLPAPCSPCLRGGSRAPASIAAGGLRFAPPKPAEAEVVKDKPKAPRVRTKNDPRLVAAARELRDRWLEQVNATPLIGQGKYDVGRAIATDVKLTLEPTQLLSAA